MPEIGNNIAQADINLVDETFDRSQSASYHLSIQTETDRLTFCVFNTVINKCIVLRSYPFSSAYVDVLISVFENDKLFMLNCKSCCHLWVSPRYTFVPEHLFAPDEADEYMTFNHGALADEETLYHYSHAANLYHLFSCPKELISLFRKYHPQIRFFHHSKPLIESIITETSPTDKVGMAIYFYSGWLDIVVVKNKKLLFYNSFQINAPADSVYYFAGVSSMFDINLSSIKLTYAGSLKQMPPEIAILENSVGQMVESEPTNALTYSHYISDPFRRNFINLINSYGCE